MLRGLTKKLGTFLASYGPGGLFAISFLDSSFVPLPGLNDALLIYLCASQPATAPLFAALATAGSLSGSLVLYWFARSGSKLALKKKGTLKGIAQAKPWLDKNGFLSMVIMSLLPPPAPFKLFLLASGVFRFPVLQFLAGLAVGRSLRFAGIAYVSARYGKEAEILLRDNLAWVSLAAVAVFVLTAFIFRRFRTNPDPDSNSGSGPESPNPPSS